MCRSTIWAACRDADSPASPLESWWGVLGRDPAIDPRKDRPGPTPLCAHLPPVGPPSRCSFSTPCTHHLTCSPDPCLGSVCLHPQPSWFGFKGYLLGWGALIIPSKMTCDPLCSPPLSCPSFSPAPAPVCLSMCCRLLPVGSAPGPGGDARLLRNLRAWNSHVRSKVG